MGRIAPGPIIVALLGCLGAAALGLTTYTLPFEGAASDPELLALLSAALHDPPKPLPSASGILAVQPVLPESTEGRSPLPARAVRLGGGAAISEAARAWVTSAAATDPAALREWLGRWVWASAVTDGDTVRITLHRVSFHPGCPWMSRLDAVSARSADFTTRLVRVTGTCPANVN
jgi:hypothetical protein